MFTDLFQKIRDGAEKAVGDQGTGAPYKRVAAVSKSPLFQNAVADGYGGETTSCASSCPVSKIAADASQTRPICPCGIEMTAAPSQSPSGSREWDKEDTAKPNPVVRATSVGGRDGN